MSEVFSFPRFIVLTGNYGSGKTEIALNLAFRFAALGEKTTLVDLDIVNPYFRSAEKAGELEKAGVRVLMPVFALTTVDIPALPPEIQSVFEQPSDRVIFDVGGDDTGAAALGRYAPAFQKNRSDTLSLLVINCMRPLTETREDILDLAERIGKRGRLGTDGLINNTNLADQTEPEMLEWGEGIVSECAREMGKRIVLNTGERRILDQCGLRFPRMEIERRMIPEWMES
ncbi:MAG: ParA family protein [Clostridia bacterium]|nr:ParA family protein [Clostridia bacterium]